MSKTPIPTRPVIRVVDDRSEAEAAVATEILQCIAERGGTAVLGLATGRTMSGIYALLAQADQSFGGVRTFNLDEYRGLAASHPASFRAEMRERFFRHIDLQPENARFPVPQLASETVAEGCERYEDEIRAAGGIDLQLLGIGRNGHLAFNEPGSGQGTRTREVELAPLTREDAAAGFAALGEEVPERAWTLGIGTILEAKALRVLAFGREKADIVTATLQGPVGPELPASFIRTHPACEIWLDRDAATGVSKQLS